MRAQDAVISRPDGVPRVRRGFFAVLTAVAWTGFAWLLAPVVTVVLWVVGAVTLYDEVVTRLGDVQVPLLLGVTGAAVLLAVVLLAWAEVQRHRFAGPERRRRPADVEPEAVAAALGADHVVTDVLRTGRVVVVHVDRAGRPVRAEVPAVEEPCVPVLPSPRSGESDPVPAL